MKVKTEGNRITEFKPFDLIITVESKEDAALLRALFNNTEIVESFRLNDLSRDVRELMSTKGELSVPFSTQVYEDCIKTLRGLFKRR